jgi:hypothetical protein
VEEHGAAGEEVAGEGDGLPGALVEALAQARPFGDLDAGEVRQGGRAGAEVGAGDGGRELRLLPDFTHLAKVGVSMFGRRAATRK